MFISLHILQPCPLLDLLSDELLRRVCSFVGPPVDKIHVMLTCHRMKRVMEHPDSWAHILFLKLGSWDNTLHGGWLLWCCCSVR